MKSFSKAILLVAAISFYPFGCEAQVNGTLPGSEGCDTIEIESPKMTEAIETAKSTIDSLSILVTFQEGKIEEWVDEAKRLGVIINEKDIIISTQSNEIGSLKTEKATLEQDVRSITSMYETSMQNVDRLLDTIKSKDVRINSLISELSEKPTTITDTIYKESEFITVNGEQFRVSDIQNVLPDQTVDTVQVGWCDPDDPLTRDYFHEGGIDQYPHFVNFASKDKGMMKVWFTVPLTDEIKAKDSITVQRIISHKIGLTQYIYLEELN